MTSELSSSELIHAIEENRLQAFSTLGQVPGGRLLATDEMVKVIPPIQVAVPLCAWVFNATLSESRTEGEVHEVIGFFQRLGIPFGWTTGPSTRPRDLSSVLEARGIEHLVDVAGMALDLDELDRPEVPRGLVTRKVRTRHDVRAWACAFREGFGLPEGSETGIAELIGAAWEHSRGTWHHYVGTLDEIPVGSSSMYLDQGVAGIYFVGTVPSARRRGIGTWMTFLALQDARELGTGWSVLHASPLGRGLYARLGFEEYCTLGIYMWGLGGDESSGLAFLGS
ncbi:MAG: GNAT family N-acetyltransferase [Anaerolineae bacterium]|jgi:ribosomal protein S18 acetylase RimI-like enzyme